MGASEDPLPRRFTYLAGKFVPAVSQTLCRDYSAETPAQDLVCLGVDYCTFSICETLCRDYSADTPAQDLVGLGVDYCTFSICVAVKSQKQLSQ